MEKRAPAMSFIALLANKVLDLLEKVLHAKPHLFAPTRGRRANDRTA
jgi:hypothetical protein